ncbi:Crossover junction endonuclease mus81 [Coelomomyces lativittatus]|nr:Crossover junction endonuclease mus81 [Coelomomyces lativittatus]
MSEIKGVGPTTIRLFEDYFKSFPSQPSPLQSLATNLSTPSDTMEEIPVLASLEHPSSFATSSSSSLKNQRPSIRSISRLSDTMDLGLKDASTSFHPSQGSPSYAVLLSLYEFSKGMDSKDALVSRTGLLSLTKKYTSANLTDVGTWFSSTQPLLKHHLAKEFNVCKKTFYCLTVKGHEVAIELSERGIQHTSTMDLNTNQQVNGHTTRSGMKRKREKSREDSFEEPSNKGLPSEHETLRSLTATTSTGFLSSSSIPSEGASPEVLSQPLVQPAFYRMKEKDEPITLIMDSREQFSNDRTYFQNALTSVGINVTTRALALGDIAWVTEQGDVLNVIVERKRFDDLIRSVQTSRFQEQVWRLKQSEAHVYYVLETPPLYFPTMAEQSTLMTSQTLLIYHGFHVHWTTSAAETVGFLNSLTQRLVHAAHPCEPYAVFTQRTLKHAFVTLQSMYTRMLQTIHGVSLEKALALVRTYPTLRQLYEALHDQGLHALIMEHPSQTLRKNKFRSTVASMIHHLFTDVEYDS